MRCDVDRSPDASRAPVQCGHARSDLQVTLQQRKPTVRKSLLTAVLAALLATPASAVTIEWVPVGNPGNAADPTPLSTCFTANCGSVAYDYRISKYETTNAQYAEFLNAADPDGTNTLGIYNASMDSNATIGGISFVSGNAAGSKYLVKPDFENKPVTYVSFYDALRFANWLNNGQGSGDTETGGYTLLGGTATPSNGTTVTRNGGAKVFLTSENEWYKATYYSPSGVYFAYPTGTDDMTGCVAPGSDTGNSANCSGAGGVLTNAGAYELSESPYGTYDQGGNVNEWNESIVNTTTRGFRGGSWNNGASDLAAVNPYNIVPTFESDILGFRVAPEPGASGLAIASVGTLLGLRRRSVTRVPGAVAVRAWRRRG
jgi:formylglycine-generating enzyme required for sulfatase activity